MTKPAHRMVTFGLLVLLLASNGWWLIRDMRRAGDYMSSLKYQQSTAHELRETAKAALSAMPALTAELPKREVVQRVADAVGEEEPFEKDGVTVVGWLSLVFDDEGRLMEARSIFTPDTVVR